MKKPWVDFAAVKQSVTMSMILTHYGVNWLREKDHELRGRCPIHKGGGEDAFHVNTEKDCFQCFSCKARGNVLDFVAAMEKCSVRDAGLKIQEWFEVSAVAGVNTATSPQLATKKDGAPKDREEGTAAAENKVLKFQLSGVDPAHEYLRDRGITNKTAETFGVGLFSGRGSMSGRVVIPIHNERGELVAYAGRSVDGSEPKYKFPTGFHKALELYNLHRITTDVKTVVLVEGFFDCIKVHEAGLPCVALMGSSLSERQEHLLCHHFTGAVLLLDGDEAGQRATDECLLRLGRRMWVKAIVVPEGKQPDQLSAAELWELLIPQAGR